MISRQMKLYLSGSQLLINPPIKAKFDALLNDNVEPRELERLVLSDVGLTAHLLKIANSAWLGRGATFETVGRAINFLGTERTQSLLMAHMLETAFRSLNFPSQFNINNFSVRATMVAKITGLLAGECGLEEGYLCGMLSHVGILMLCDGIGNPYVERLNMAKTSADLAQFERADWDCINIEITTWLLEQWSIPDRITAQIAQPPPESPPSNLATANALADVLLTPAGRNQVGGTSTPAQTLVLQQLANHPIWSPSEDLLLSAHLRGGLS